MQNKIYFLIIFPGFQSHPLFERSTNHIWDGGEDSWITSQWESSIQNKWGGGGFTEQEGGPFDLVLKEKENKFLSLRAQKIIDKSAIFCFPSPLPQNKNEPWMTIPFNCQLINTNFLFKLKSKWHIVSSSSDSKSDDRDFVKQIKTK